jgi:hypothetical protein
LINILMGKSFTISGHLNRTKDTLKKFVSQKNFRTQKTHSSLLEPTKSFSSI